MSLADVDLGGCIPRGRAAKADLAERLSLLVQRLDGREVPDPEGALARALGGLHGVTRAELQAGVYVIVDAVQAAQWRRQEDRA